MVFNFEEKKNLFKRSFDGYFIMIKANTKYSNFEILRHRIILLPTYVFPKLEY